MNTIRTYNTKIILFLDDKQEEISNKIYEEILEILKTNGYTVEQGFWNFDKTPREDENIGAKQRLQYRIEKRRVGFCLEFFDKDKDFCNLYEFEELVYLAKKQFIVIKEKIINKLKEMLDNLNIVFNIEFENKDFKYAEDRIKNDMVKSWHKPQKDINFNLSDLDGTSDNNLKDKNGKKILNGEIKYFRNYKGRLQRGKVYEDINQNLYVLLNRNEYTVVNAKRMFDFEPNLPRKVSNYMSDKIIKDSLRNLFSKFFSYKDIIEDDISKLTRLINQEIAKLLIRNENSILERAKTKKSKVLKNGLKYAFIEVDGTYFSNREAISFNENGFIGFSGWASCYNNIPFIKSFFEWIKYLARQNDKDYLEDFKKELNYVETKLNVYLKQYGE